MSTAKRIRRFIEGSLLDDTASAADPLAAGLLDSLEIEQLVGHLEDEYGVSFTDEDLVTENFTDLDTLATLVDQKRREAS